MGADRPRAQGPEIHLYPLHMNISPRCMPLVPDSGVATRRNRTGYSSSSRLALGHERRTSLTKIFMCKGYTSNHERHPGAPVPHPGGAQAGRPRQLLRGGTLRQGTRRHPQKIGEEAAETLMAAKDGVPDKIVHEVADLWFHTLVLLAQQGLGPDAVLAELNRRFGLSGLEEKTRRRD